MVRGRRVSWVRVAIAIVGVLLTAAPDGSAQLPTLTPDDYASWERLGSWSMSPDGAWVVASIGFVGGDGELRLHSSDGPDDPLVLPHGRGPIFARSGAFMAYRVGASEDEREAAEEPIHDRLGLVDLRTGADSVLFATTGMSFRDDGAWLAVLGVPASDSVGADLIVMDPGTGQHTVIGNVEDFAWQDEGPLLAATLSTAWGSANGVVLFDPEAGTLRTLDSGDADYGALTWRTESDQLAVLRSVEEEGRQDASHEVLVWDDVRQGTERRLDPVTRDALGVDLRITDFVGLTFSEDGRTLFFGVRPWEEEPEDEAEEEEDEVGDDDDPDAGAEDVEPADVQVWHWDDDQILRAQEWRDPQIRRQTLLTAWHLDDDHVVVLGQELDEPVRIVAGGDWGVVGDVDPYAFARRFGAGTTDWYRVDVRTGARTLIVEAAESGLQSHSDLDRILAYADDRWTAYGLDDLDAVPIADGRSFEQSLAAYDYPGPRPPWGLGAWREDGRRALIYDEHDVYSVDLESGQAERLTDGVVEGLVYRVAPVDPDASPFGAAFLETGEPIWYRVFDPRTKDAGYAEGSWNRGVEHRLSTAARVTGLKRARDEDVFAYRAERWDDSPDVFVGGRSLEDAVQVTETNPAQSEFAWGRSELIDYTTDAGHDLQAILVYPADFTEGEEYPLILYQYERLSDNLHAYEVPSERDYYNYQAWSQAGYFVLMPDIVYEPGRPGPSALDAVEHALDAAVATGHVDADAMGLIGHSWGGYQASYLPTRTDRFAASVAGAAITNFMSFMGAVHWNGGLPETGHWETGQARMAAPYWEDLEGHLESSPANLIADLETPMLLMHGDADGVVDFGQGLEFYNYARRAGKEVVMLVYPGADHGLSDEAQQVDYHRRILEWFDHHLRGADPAPWITDGESWIERSERIGR